MCGISGKFSFDSGAIVAESTIRSMLGTITHRGPDDSGIYVAPQVGLGHQRLSIIGLETGHQPLTNETGTVWITFNGEIYNYLELRQSLEAKGHVFKTTTDTEVIVHLYEDYGEECVAHLRGMFAFGIWDALQKTLFLARDRVGIKPLYYYTDARSIVFGSEIKAILADPEVETEIEPAVIDRFLTFFYLPGEDTLLRGIKKLEPGYFLVAKDGRVTVKRYWDLQFEPEPMTIRQAEERLDNLLQESIQLHMISDVPVGVLLSGGVDSTAILSLASGVSDRPLSTYTIGFAGGAVTDERPYARIAADLYGSEHHEMTISAADFQAFLPQYVWHMEEPVCEPPAVALYYVSRLASKFVKVLLSGEGGDEAFAGYPNYRNLLWLERAKRILGPLRGISAAGLGALSAMTGSQRLAKYVPLLQADFDSYYFSRTSNPFTRFNADSDGLYSESFSQAASKAESLRPLHGYLDRAPSGDMVNRMLYVDTKTWLPDDLLVKADKMTMANSVELRVPLLDHKLLEFAACLPGSFKVRGLDTKYLAKRTLARQVPAEIRNRKKTGFPVPYHGWLRNELRDWLYDLLLGGSCVTRRYFRRRGVERLLEDDRRSGAFSKEIFSLAVLELWHRTFVTSRGTNARC